MITSGFWTLGQFAGAPIRIHWSVVILMLYFGGWEPAAWVGIVALVLVHELGHALVVRAVGARVTEVMVYGFGGYCGWRGYATARSEALIAWGGVVAQAVVYGGATIYLSNVMLSSRFEAVLLGTLTSSNLSLIVINLIPIEPLDGAKAWKLIPILWNDLQRAWATRASAPRAGAAKPGPRNAPPTSGAPGNGSAPSKASVGVSAASPTGTDGPDSARVQDPATAERMFQQVYEGLISGDQEAGDATAPAREDGSNEDPDKK